MGSTFVRQFMLDMMAGMMPYMMPLVWLGAGLVVAGVLAAFAGLVSGSAGVGRIASLAGRLLVVLGVFFLVCQVAGMLLGATPAINFGDSTKYEFDLKPFWTIGLAFLIPGILICRASRRRT